MYTPAPSEQELAAAGLTEEDLEWDAVEVWPENVQAYQLFSSLQTQWRVGMSGPSGLDYNVMYRMIDRMKLSNADAEDLEYDVRAMESEALSAMHERAEK
ncbi:DUF1799 domain-containing protein [Massilia sp. TN1-12]|uniref:DUF1799 domain-containing protein n=1 Tax=Massilia paldalensis TaxID=3377675 RepID=UPI00384BF17B